MIDASIELIFMLHGELIQAVIASLARKIRKGGKSGES